MDRIEATPRRAPPAYVTVEEFLIWAYGRQRVDVMSGRTLHELEAIADGDHEAHGTSADGVATLMRRGILGCRVDGNTGCWGASAECHPDAERLHDIVWGMDWIDASLLMQFGRSGLRPEETAAIPRPGPAIPSRYIEQREGDQQSIGDRYGRARVDGVTIEYRIAVVETIVERTPVYKKIGRGKYEFSHDEVTKTEVLMCPLSWWPDQAYVDMMRGVAERFDQAIDRLHDLLADEEFVDHRIVDCR